MSLLEKIKTSMLGAGPVLRKNNTCKANTHAGKTTRVRQTRMQEKQHVQDIHACRRGKHARHA
jgi:hypothetical protein